MSDVATAALLLRLPEPLKEWLRERAVHNNRSMTAEVKFILKSVQAEDPPSLIYETDKS